MRESPVTGDPAFEIPAYAARLDYRGKLDPCIETLRGLHEAHTLTVPFENLDVRLGRPILLDPATLFRKIVCERRGGYCFELNGLFAALLERIGFPVHRLMARVLYGAATVRPLSHEVLLVEADGGRWLADVGFGGNGLIAPLPLRAGHEERQYQEHVRLVGREGRTGPVFVLQFESADVWHDLYEFSLERYAPEDYILPNYYHSHAPESLFMRHVICTKPTVEGRIILLDRKLKIRERGETRHAKADRPEEFRMFLKTHFGIEQDELAADLARGWERLGA